MLLMIKTHEIIAANVKKLMEHKQMRQTEFAKKTGVSQRTISNAINPGSVGSVTMDTVEKIAFYFGIEAYHLLIPNLTVTDLLDIRIEGVITKYAQTSEHGRQEIIRTTDNEYRYNIASQPASQPASQLASRDEPSRAEPSRAEPSRAEPQRHSGIVPTKESKQTTQRMKEMATREQECDGSYICDTERRAIERRVDAVMLTKSPLNWKDLRSSLTDRAPQDDEEQSMPHQAE